MLALWLAQPRRRTLACSRLRPREPVGCDDCGRGGRIATPAAADDLVALIANLLKEFDSSRPVFKPFKALLLGNGPKTRKRKYMSVIGRTFDPR